MPTRRVGKGQGWAADLPTQPSAATMAPNSGHLFDSTDATDIELIRHRRSRSSPHRLFSCNRRSRSRLTSLRRRTRLPPTTPDTTDSGETEQQRLDCLYPVGSERRCHSASHGEETAGSACLTAIPPLRLEAFISIGSPAAIRGRPRVHVDAQGVRSLRVRAFHWPCAATGTASSSALPQSPRPSPSSSGAGVTPHSSAGRLRSWISATSWPTHPRPKAA